MPIDILGEIFSKFRLNLECDPYLTNGTFIYRVPALVHELFVEVSGAGGGGRGSDGGYGAQMIAVVPGQEFTITVGAGGTSGNSGGTSSFGSEISASGGGSNGASEWNPSHGTSSAIISMTGGGSRGGPVGGSGENGSVKVWRPMP